MNNKISVLDKGYVEYVDHFGSDQRIVEAARTSYNGHSKGKEKDKKLLFYLYRNRHSSPMEMVGITFKIKMPLFVAAQHNRHRMQSLNYQSFRYCEPEEEFYIPSEWRKQDVKNKQSSVSDGKFNPDVFDPIEEVNESATDLFDYSCRYAFKVYENMIESGIAREMARMVLPQNLYTTCYSNWDLNNLLKYFSLRDDPHAQWEIQQYAKAMKDITTEYFPWSMEAYEKYGWKLVEKE